METTFRVILPVLVLAFALHRGYYVRKQGEEKNTLKQREEGAASKIAGVLAMVAFLSTIVYALQPAWLAWAALPLPIWLRWAGVGIALLGFALLQWAQNTLGKSWSDRPRMMQGQTLITGGPYRWVRHPIYTAFLLIFGSTLLSAGNWLVGLTWLGMTALEVASRIQFEESLMLEYFGTPYRDYMRQTGRLLPSLLPPLPSPDGAKSKTK